MTDESKPLMTSIAPSVSPISENKSTGASSNSGDGDKRFRKITPKIQALKALFEFRNVSLDKESSKDSFKELNKENIDDSKRFDEKQLSSPVKETSYLEDIKTATESQPALNDQNSTERTSTESTIPSPLKARSHNILKSVPSLADIRKRRKGMKDEKKKPIPENTSKFLDAKQSRAWQDKINLLAEYCDAFTVDPIPEVVSIVSDRPKIFGIEENISSMQSNIRLLTPDEDLAECVDSKSCHPHRIPYFAKVIREVGLKTSL
jgi:hypothetical protein